MIAILLRTAAVLLLLLSFSLTLELTILTFSILFLRRRTPSISESVLPFRLTVIIPAHNQAASIGSTVVSLRVARHQARKDDIRILVIAHNCTDATADHARHAGAEVRILDSPGGKGAALAFAFATVPADGYLVIDAGSIVDPLLLQRVQSRFAEGADAIQCSYEALLAAASMRARLDTIAFRALNVIRPIARQRLDLSCGILGNGFALRRTLLDRISYSLVVEDVELHLLLVQANIHVRYLDDVTVRSPISDPEPARWDEGRLGTAIRTLPGVLLHILTGKFRLFEPALDIAALPITLQTTALLLALLLPFPQLRIYSLVSLAILALHTVIAIFHGDTPGSDFRALVYAPIYFVQKLIKLSVALFNTIKNSLPQPSPADNQQQPH